MTTTLTMILAGNAREFSIWCHQNKISMNDPNVRYVTNAESLYGLVNFRLIRFRTWYARRDLRFINEQIQIRKLVGKVEEI